jgi:hypothetical protein
MNTLVFDVGLTNSSEQIQMQVEIPQVPANLLVEEGEEAFNLWAQYHELMRRITPEERKQIEDKLRDLPAVDNTIAELREVIKNNNLKSPIFQNPDYPFYALLAVKTGKIPLAEFVTIMFFWTQNVKDGSFPIESISLFLNNGEVNPKARQVLKETLEHVKNIQKFSEEQLETLIDEILEKMRSAFPLEQQFFIESKESKIQSLFNFILQKQPPQKIYSGFSDYLWGFQDWHNKYFMMPSCTLMQTFQDVLFKENAIRMNFVLGLSSERDIAKGVVYSSRDVAVHFPFVDLINEADLLKAPGNYFTKHDEFHASQCGATGRLHRMFWTRMAHVLSDIDKGLSDLLIDMGVFEYSSDQSNPSKQKDLWKTMYNVFQRKGCDSKILKAFLKELHDKEDEYTQEFGITLAMISEEAQECDSHLKTPYNLYLKEFSKIILDIINVLQGPTIT